MRCRCLLIQSPRITTFFQLRNGVIGHRKPLLFSQTFFQGTYDLAHAAKCEGDGVWKDLSSCL